MTKSRLTLALLFPLAFGSAGAAGPLSAGQAAEEVRAVVASVERHHPDPFHAASRDEFYREVDALLAREGEVTAADQFFGLSRLLSLVSDTHTQLHATEETDAFRETFPLRFRIFPEGLFVIAGDEAYRDAIGARVAAVGGREPDDVLEELARYSPSDNWPRKRVFAEMFLYLPETYDFLGLEPELTLEGPDGERWGLELKETWDRGLADFTWDTLNPFLPEGLLTVHDVRGTEPPEYLRRLDENYRWRFLEGERRHLYVQFNQQVQGEGVPHILDFHQEWVQALRENEDTELLIVDLRNDPGGDINLTTPMSGILSRLAFELPALQAVVVLLGPDTVSAGTIFAAQLEELVGAVVVGGPSGSSPNMFLAADKQVLPHSRIRLEVSTYDYVTTREADRRAYVAPDVPVAAGFEDYANGRDPVLEAAQRVTGDDLGRFYAGAKYPFRRESQQAAGRPAGP